MGLLYAAVWLVVTLVAASALFLQSQRTVVVASHDAVISPQLGGKVVLRTGAILPDLRIDSGTPIGVEIRLGKTNAESPAALVQRYGYIASQPDGQVKKVRDEIVSMAFDAGVRGAIIGLVPILLWLLVGSERRNDLLRRLPTRQGGLAAAIVLLVVAGLWAPWEDKDDETLEGALPWQTLEEFLGPQVPIPEDLDGVEVRGDATTAQTRRLIESALHSFDQSKEFYAAVAEEAAELDLRRPEEDETVVALVSDRHDNIGMDPVARAIADAGGATMVYDAGDDTSVGQQWEAFSLDSVSEAFEDYDERWGVAGNHDHGDFVEDYLAEQGWSMLNGEVVDGPDDTRLLGVGDPRSSGLGDWRDQTGLGFDEVRTRLADTACAADEEGDRVQTILVHDANLADEALERGCVDLVLGGHLHVAEGPEAVLGENGDLGYSYTTGTTGGAAYAIAIGSKIRRPAMVTLVTYADSRPVGLQAVTLQSNGVLEVDEYMPLGYEPAVATGVDDGT